MLNLHAESSLALYMAVLHQDREEEARYGSLAVSGPRGGFGGRGGHVGGFGGGPPSTATKQLAISGVSDIPYRRRIGLG